jgi:hypothetical protein
MSDKASQPVEEPDSGVNGADLLNKRESPLSIIGDLSRISWRTEIANADRHPLESARKNDEETEDFVAVDHDDVSDYAFSFRRTPAAEDRHSQLDDLHPFVQLLTKSNVDDCEKVEEAFPVSERASREKVCTPDCAFLSSLVGISTCLIIPCLCCKNNDFSGDFKPLGYP